MSQCIADFGLRAVAMKFFPFEATEVGRDALEGVFAEDSPSREIALTIGPPALPAKGGMDFLDKNPESLRLAIERKGSEGLRQTSLSARTSNPRVLEVWKTISRRLKRLTKTGVVAVDPKTGARVPARSFRYSAGAKALALSGVPMLPIAGDTVLEFLDD